MPRKKSVDKNKLAARKPGHKAPSPKGPFRLNLGCGDDIRDGFINIDKIEKDGILTLDLELIGTEKRFPYPDGSVEYIQAFHVLEHLNNFVGLMQECYRVLKHNGVLCVAVPIYPSTQAFQDPTHVRFFTDKTFYYCLQGSPLWDPHGKNYGLPGFRILNQDIRNGWELIATLRK